MSRRWIEYFEKMVSKKTGVEFAVEHWNYHGQLYAKIKGLVSPPAKILEVGCGYGLSSIYLQGCGYEVTATDSDAEIVTAAKKYGQLLNVAIKVEQADAFDLQRYYTQFDLCFSAGVVEHFEKPLTINLLREQARCARYVIAVIPTRYTKYSGKITDERMYRMRELKKLFKEADLEVVSTFGYGDIPALRHGIMRFVLPGGVYLILQKYFSYAMNMGGIGMAKECKKSDKS